MLQHESCTSSIVDSHHALLLVTYVLLIHAGDVDEATSQGTSPVLDPIEHNHPPVYATERELDNPTTCTLTLCPHNTNSIGFHFKVSKTMKTEIGEVHLGVLSQAMWDLLPLAKVRTFILEKLHVYGGPIIDFVQIPYIENKNGKSFRVMGPLGKHPLLVVLYGFL